jgi:single-strand selective monofunctional uracil DNA glycosylase
MQPERSPQSKSDAVIKLAKQLCEAVKKLRFAAPVAYVYNPLEYAWAAHEMFLSRYANTRKRVVFLGMNPGPFGMVQTGVPFGQIAAVRDWLRIRAPIERPVREHPKRLVLGFDCGRSEISGERLWGLFASRFGTADAFFQEHLVVNYCPLAFVEDSGRNRTPDKLPTSERKVLFEECDEHLRGIVEILRPEWLIGVGDFAANRCQHTFAGKHIQIAKILHPSPACPASNIDWAGKVTRQLQQLGVWR